MSSPDAPSALTGTLIEGRYRLDAVIARGGMSTVYLATDDRLDRHVAVKLLDPSLAGDRAFVDRFALEARSAAKLSDPGVVQVFDQGMWQGQAFLVMEVVPGGTLRELLDERGPMPPYAVAAVLRPMLGALKEAHSQGLVHRDIKPENILISTGGAVKLADFGLVRAVSEARATSTSVVMGTAAYLSPEQIRGADTDGRSDLYSLGVLAYELLTGTPPFSGDTSVAVAYQRLERDVPAPSEHPSAPPGVLDDLVLGATSRDPAERYSDSAHMLRALESVAASAGFPAYVVPAPRDSAWAEARDAAAERTRPGDASEFEVAESESGETPAAHRAGAAHAAPAAGPHPTRVETRLDHPAYPPHEQPPGPPPPARRPHTTTLAPRRRAGCVWAVLVAALALLLAVGGWWLGSGRFTEVPTVTGLSVGEGTSLLSDAGLSAATREAYSDDMPVDRLVGSDPAAGERVARGDRVDLLVSVGRPVVPDLGTRRDVPGVTAALEERTLHAEVGPEEYSDSVREGLVISLDPGPGTTVGVGTTVQLTVSRGPAPVEVPDVHGLDPDAARTALEAAGLGVSTTRDVFDPELEAGRASATEPAAGTGVGRGSDVVLLVSNSIEVPDIVGDDLDDAEAALAEAGLTVVREPAVTDNRVLAGHVAETRPAAGELVDPANPTVRLVPSNSVRVPMVLGSRLDDARQTLDEAGLRAQSGDRPSSAFVYGQVPLPGRVVAEGTEVELDVLG